MEHNIGMPSPAACGHAYHLYVASLQLVCSTEELAILLCRGMAALCSVLRPHLYDSWTAFAETTCSALVVFEVKMFAHSGFRVTVELLCVGSAPRRMLGGFVGGSA